MVNVNSLVAIALCTLVPLVLPIPAGAKCLPGVVEVDVRVATATDGPVNVKVRLQTPKGDFENSATGQADFTVKVPFDRWSSFSVWRGERCKNLPTMVVIAADVKGKTLGEVKIKFKGNAIISGAAEYRLHGRLLVEASGIKFEGPSEVEEPKGQAGRNGPPK